MRGGDGWEFSFSRGIPPPASKTAQQHFPAAALFNLKLGTAMAKFEFKPDNRGFLTKLGEVARVTSAATSCVLDHTNKALVVTNKVLEQTAERMRFL